MAVTLRLDDVDASALRAQADREGRTMHDLERQAVRDYLERADRRSRIDAALSRELPRYDTALRRLGE
ncbi:MAG: ribbon-helix-helix protein, CopG family [Kineosporiaceae bacterium]